MPSGKEQRIKGAQKRCETVGLESSVVQTELAETELHNAKWSGDAERMEEAARRAEAHGLSLRFSSEIEALRAEAQRLRAERVHAQMRLSEAGWSGK